MRLPCSKEALRIAGTAGSENLVTVRQHLVNCNDKLAEIQDGLQELAYESKSIHGAEKRDICSDLNGYDHLLQRVQETMERCPWVTDVLREVFRREQLHNMNLWLIGAFEILESCFERLQIYK